MSGQNLLGLRGPGVGDDQAPAVGDFGTDINAILCAGDQAVEQAEVAQRNRGAGLQGDDALRRVRQGALIIRSSSAGSATALDEYRSASS